MLKIKFNPIHILSFSFLGLILIGSLLLKLPFSTNNGISFIDSFFISASAICVTGLATIDVATTFTIFGKIILLLLIQIGGLGIMTFVGVVIQGLKQRLSISNEMVLEYAFLQKTPNFSIKHFLFFLIKYTLVIEFFGAIVYFFNLNEKSIIERIFSSFFHSVSAFCNAGFALYSDSLMQYRNDYWVNIITMFLIITGGIGFIVVFEIKGAIKNRIFLRKFFYYRFFSLHSFIVITTTIFLILFGAGFIYFTNNLTILESFFQSVTCRTAGFNTVDLTQMSKASVFIMMFLMFIGGSPGSTAGGIKTTTFAVLSLIIFMAKNQFEDVAIHKRRIPMSIVYQSLIIFLLSMFISFIGFIFLIIYHPNADITSLLFEVISAMGTVGLSLNFTPNLIFESKIVIILLMFIGRVGTITIFSVFLNRNERELKYAEEKILIG